MGLLVYKFSDYNHTAEREQYINLCKQLSAYYHGREEICLFIANYNIYDCELDGILIKQDAIMSVEFKNYGGKVTARNNGHWTLADGTKIMGGSRKTVFQQANLNHVAIKRGFEDGGILSKRSLKNVSALVVFHQPIVLDNQLEARTQSWLHVCDETTFMDKVKAITSKSTDLSREEMLSLREKLALREEFLDEEFSNVELLEKKEPEIGEEKESDEHQPATVEPSEMMSNMALPSWLDDYLFGTLKAHYHPSRADMTVIDWDKLDLLNYLGTYFPRSFAESYCIFSYLFADVLASWKDKQSLSVFDFGCGTGGELVGLIAAVGDRMPTIKHIDVHALDGNNHALRLCEKIISTLRERTGISIPWSPIPYTVDDAGDMATMVSTMNDDFDIVISFKTICEFISTERFQEQNAYKCFIESMLPMLRQGGTMLLADVTTYSDKESEWLPKIMDTGMRQAGCCVVRQNMGYNQTFTVSHTRKKDDVSKIAWRLIKKNN